MATRAGAEGSVASKLETTSAPSGFFTTFPIALAALRGLSLESGKYDKNRGLNQLDLQASLGQYDSQTYPTALSDCFHVTTSSREIGIGRVRSGTLHLRPPLKGRGYIGLRAVP